MPRVRKSPQDPYQGHNPSPSEAPGRRSMLASAGLHLLVLGTLVGWIPFVPNPARGVPQRQSAVSIIPFIEPTPAPTDLAPEPEEFLPPLPEIPSDSLDPGADLEALVFPEIEPSFPPEVPLAPSPRDLIPAADSDPFATVDPHLRLTPERTPVPSEPTSTEPIPEASQGQQTALDEPEQIPGQCEEPPYPAWAARSKISAEVRLAITVGDDGKVRGVEIISSTGNRTLIENAARSVWSWRYRPAQENGEPVEAVVSKTIRYVP